MMRAKAIKVGVGGVGAIVAYYAALQPGVAAPARYYGDPSEPAGRWQGSGCEQVDLAGEVDREQLEAMLDARHPTDGSRLGRAFGTKSARAFDATYSAPKSVSVLWALADDPTVRDRIAGAHDTAVTAALSWFETHGNVTRRGTNGIHQVDAQGLCIATFRQHTSRALDPQLHTHAVVWSKVQDPTGRWLSLDARFLVKQQRAISRIYDTALRSELSRELGVTWIERGDTPGVADIAEVPQALLDAFSERTGQVEARLRDAVDAWSRDHDGAEPDRQTLYRLERDAALHSRPDKSHDLTADELRAEWRSRADALDLEPIAIDPAAAGPARWDDEQVIADAIAAVTEAGATWLQADLAREIAARLPATAAIGADEFVALVDSLAQRAVARCVALHPVAEPGTPVRRDGRAVTEHVTDRLYSTVEILEEEQRLVDWAASRVQPAAGSPAGRQQAEVAEAVAGYRPLVLVVGPAGAGKTTAMRAAARTMRLFGRDIVGIAPSGKAADVLAQTSGCQAKTLAKLLHDHRTGQPLPRPETTIVLDEAGMTRTDDLESLVRLCEERSWRLVCIGDPAQLPAVGRGGMFAHWCETFDPHRLDEVRRFTHPWEATASLALRRGDPVVAATYAEHGRIEAVHPALLARAVARRYLDDNAAGGTTAITTASRDNARSINVEIQQRLRPTRPGEPTIELADGTELRVGDRVATRRNDATLRTDLGATVRNRHTWDVAAIGRDGTVRVIDPERGAVDLPLAYVARHLELGWAVTGYGTQGTTVDRAICVVEPASSRAGIYVGLTRGREHNLAVVLDATGTADPEAALASAIERPANARTALAVRDHLHEARGIQPPAPPAIDPGTALDAPTRADDAGRALGR